MLIPCFTTTTQKHEQLVPAIQAVENKTSGRISNYREPFKNVLDPLAIDEKAQYRKNISSTNC